MFHFRASPGDPLDRPPIDSAYELDHRYTRTSGRVFLTGVQALVRLPLLQRERDLAASRGSRR